MLLKLDQVSKGFGKEGDPAYRHVLDGLSMEVGKGESVAILGPSGSGKTTLLNLIGGLEFPDSGSVEFNGKEIGGFSARETDRYRNRQIGFVFQFHHLLPQLTLLENILIPTLADGKDPSPSNPSPSNPSPSGPAERAEALMRRVGIWEFRDRLPGKLSGGECQRAAVVRAMINAPSLLLADEPTGALDGKNVEAMAELLTELNREEGTTLILVTHSTGLARRMGRTLTLASGKLEE